MSQVLVLNQDYQAISLCEPSRAMILVLLQKAEMVADLADRKMRSVHKEFRYPSIIRLQNYVQLPYKKIRLTRKNVFVRDRHTCAYCGSTDRLTLDHLVPRAQGGGTHWNNLITACEPCNSFKGDQSLEDSGLQLSHKPFRPSFIMYMSVFAGQVHEAWKPFLMMG